MDKVRDIFLYFVAAMTMFTFLGAVYQAFNDQKASALTLGTLFLIGALIVFIPQLEVIKTLGVEARLRQTVTEAMASLESFRRLSAISAKATYMQMAWGNRIGAPSAKDKQLILDEVHSQLVGLKVSADELKAIQRPFVQMIALDFYFLYARVLRAYAESRYTALVRRANKQDTAESREARDEHSERISSWNKRISSTDPANNLKKIGLEAYLRQWTPSDREWLNASEREIATRFREQIVALNATCEQKGGYTEEAAEYYDRYADSDGAKALAEELFQDQLRELRK